MKKWLLLLLFSAPCVVPAQTLVSYNLIATYSTTQVDSILAANGIPNIILPSTYDINAYKVVYNTLDADSLPVIASGALFVPINPVCKIPLSSYQHGTISVKSEVPSTLGTMEVLVGETNAADGVATAMPDYLGLGDSPGLHPYIHAQTEARATADLLVVCKQLLADMGYQWNGQLFLTGYSQGGHSTMAANQMIQESYSQYFSVTACTPMSGPYDVSGVQAGILSSNNPYPDPAYLPYLLLAYNSVYHIYPAYSDFLAYPYDSILPPLFDGTHELSDVDDVMPSVPNQIIVPAVLDSFLNDSTYKLHQYLKLNDTYHWIPANPLRMFYCEADMDVSYQNAVVAYDTFLANGCTTVSKMSSGANLDHGDCAFPSLLNSKAFFDSLRLDKLKITFELHPASSALASDGSITAHVHSGYRPYSYLWDNGSTDSTITNVPSGLYSVTATDSSGCPATFTTYLSVQVGVQEFFTQQTSVSPNPMHSLTTISFPVAGNYTLHVTDAWGNEVLSDRFYGSQYVILRRNLPSGIYFCRMQKDEGLPFVKMVVME